MKTNHNTKEISSKQMFALTLKDCGFYCQIIYIQSYNMAALIIYNIGELVFLRIGFKMIEKKRCCKHI